MDADTLEKIFVPFFTTKETGSGIGLSLSRQIMRIHNGNISCDSAPGAGTTVSMLF
jgi:signal transduction histidine kinase